MIISLIITIVGIIFISYYSIKISHLLHSPIDNFLILLTSIKASDLLCVDIFQDCEEGSIDSFSYSHSIMKPSFHSNKKDILADENDETLKDFLTSKDTITLYN